MLFGAEKRPVPSLVGVASGHALEVVPPLPLFPPLPEVPRELEPEFEPELELEWALEVEPELEPELPTLDPALVPPEVPVLLVLAPPDVLLEALAALPDDELPALELLDELLGRKPAGTFRQPESSIEAISETRGGSFILMTSKKDLALA